MKNKLSYVLMMMLLPAFSFAQGFVIKGKVPGIISGYARFETHKHEGDKSHDEMPEKVRIINGEFELRGKVAKPEIMHLTISTKQVSIFLENAEYTIETTFSELNDFSVKGGTLNPSKNNYLQSKLRTEAFIRKYPAEPHGAYLLNIEFADSLRKMQELFNVLAPEVQNSYFGREIKEKLKADNTPTLTGKPAPAAVLTGPDGKEFSWNRFAGKIVVVDFWASWCKPCRLFLPTLRKLYQEYSQKGIEFLSVSVDDKADKWKIALKEENMPWPQGLGQHGFTDAGLKKAFLFNAIPYMVIIGKDGKVASEVDFYKKARLSNELDRLLSESK